MSERRPPIVGYGEGLDTILRWKADRDTFAACLAATGPVVKAALRWHATGGSGESVVALARAAAQLLASGTYLPEHDPYIDELVAALEEPPHTGDSVGETKERARRAGEQAICTCGHPGVVHDGRACGLCACVRIDLRDAGFIPSATTPPTETVPTATGEEYDWGEIRRAGKERLPVIGLLDLVETMIREYHRQRVRIERDEE